MNKELEEAKKQCKHIIKFYTDLDTIHSSVKKCDEIQAIETVLQALANSISKEAIEEKINKYKQQLRNTTKRVVQLQILEQNKMLQQSEWEELSMLFGDIEKIRGKIEVLKELLEGK